MKEHIQKLQNWNAKRKASIKEPETFTEHVIAWFKTVFSAVFFIMIINGLFLVLL